MTSGVRSPESNKKSSSPPFGMKSFCLLFLFIACVQRHYLILDSSHAFSTVLLGYESRRASSKTKQCLASNTPGATSKVGTVTKSVSQSRPTSLTKECRNGNSTNSTADLLNILPQLYTYQNPRQSRLSSSSKHSRPRKPRFYWHSIDNLRHELDLFWREHEVPSKVLKSSKGPPIPSEFILNSFKRNDLRWAIAQMGGRENVSHLLGGAVVIPGKWNDAKDFEIVQYLESSLFEHEKLRFEKLPDQTVKYNATTNTTNDMSRISRRVNESSYLDSSLNSCESSVPKEVSEDQKLISLVQTNPTSRALHNATKTPKREFWSKEKAIQQLYIYLEQYNKYKHRPTVWMPQLSEISQEGYSQLFNACSRFKKLPSVSVLSILSQSAESHHNLVEHSPQNKKGASDCPDGHDIKIETLAGLVPFQEWRFFESQLQLFVELKQYLELHHYGNEDVFPEPSDVLANGFTQLYHLIRVHGGKVLLAQKLSMNFAWETDTIPNDNDRNAAATSNAGRAIYAATDSSNINWGPITLDFAISLLYFIRNQYLLMTPPLTCALITMPSEKDLLRSGKDELALQVAKFGGYENVARRLGLAYFDWKNQRIDEKTIQGAKFLWEKRAIGIQYPQKGARNAGRLKKRKGIAWDQDLVIEELRSYTIVNMTKRGFPAVWMPQFSHLEEDGRADLRNAISKFGGVNSISNAAGLVPFSVWNKFELFLELLKQLSKYLNAGAVQMSSATDDCLQNDAGALRNNRFKELVIPTTPKLKSMGFHRLADLIRMFGGRKQVIERLGVGCSKGAANVEFYIEILSYVRSNMESKQPPYSQSIYIPLEHELISSNRGHLVHLINSHGGFDIVAQRLGIAHETNFQSEI